MIDKMSTREVNEWLHGTKYTIGQEGPSNIELMEKINEMVDCINYMSEMISRLLENADDGR